MTVSFSVHGIEMEGEGMPDAPDPVKFFDDRFLVNEGSGWGGGTFRVPDNQGGIYMFVWTFVKDPMEGHTTDDTWVDLFKTTTKGTEKVSPGAWAGQGDGRRLGTRTVIIPLAGGDRVQFKAHANGNRYRIMYFSASGLKIA